MINKGILTSIAIVLFSLSVLYGQNSRSVIHDYLTENSDQLGLNATDLENWRITSEYPTVHNGITHIHIQQEFNGIDLFNKVGNFAIDRNGIIHLAGNRMIGNVSDKINTTEPVIDQDRALSNALEMLGLESGSITASTFEKVFFMPDGEAFRLSWYCELHTQDQLHVWSVMVDAVSGAILDHWDQVLHCSFGETGFKQEHNHQHTDGLHTSQSTERGGDANVYNVYPHPVESPSHGDRSLEVNPADETASPFGWHDQNGVEGAEHTITRGNNVWAYEDADGNNAAGYSPDGGANLIFDFPIQADVVPSVNRDAAITNLFYWCNIIHDVTHKYGFDEPSGNFQANNYGNGPTGGDEVRAEAQDGSGVNNANFFTPTDGFNPRMQMYLWTGEQTYLTVNSPAGIAGSYITTDAQFGPAIPTTPLTADIVLFDDGTEVADDACEDAVNGAEISGKITLIQRMDCTFVSKIEKAQAAGAVAVIIYNNVAGNPINMGGTSGSINIPSVMVSMEDGLAIKEQLDNEVAVNATIVDASTGTEAVDGDFDNGVVTHEYAHGISTRLVGGRNNNTCLSNNEQMGEGWSDWYGMMLTMDMSAPNPVYRPIGTYAISEEPDGSGIRPAPYDTSFTVNSYTYGNLGDEEISVPHGVGFIWSTMLWDLTWAFIDEYGFDDDIYNGTGGNNMILQLVTDALKLTACNPGFTDGRDAILMADELNNGGANQCMIWEVFARRGLGFSSSQGFPLSVVDGTEAFDLPVSCTNTTQPVIADFIVNTTVSCDGAVSFTDASDGVITSWSWDFGDGTTSTEENPLHQYAESGIYTVTLTVSDDVTNDEITQENLVTVVLLDVPGTTGDVSGCSGDMLTLSASSENTTTWYDTGNNEVGTGGNFTTDALTGNTSFFVSDVQTVGEIVCESEKAEISVTIFEAAFEANETNLTVTFTDMSVNATSWSWDFGDGTSSTEQNPVHVYTDGGTYTVTLTVDGTCTETIVVNVVASAVQSLFEQAGVELIPNPANSYAVIHSGMDLPARAVVQLIGTDGRIVAEKTLRQPTSTTEIGLSGVAGGMYNVVITLDSEILVQRKLVVFKK